MKKIFAFVVFFSLFYILITFQRSKYVPIMATTIKACVKNDFTKKTGKSNIKIRVSHNGSTRMISTPWEIEPEYMREDGTIDTDYPSANKLNRAINELKNEYYDIIDGIGKDIRDMDIKTLTERLKNKDMVKDFLLFFKARMCELESGKQFNTLNSYSIVYNLISGYKQEIPFRSLTPQFIDDLIARLRARGCKNSSIKRYVAIMQSVFNVAIRKSVVSMPSPFKDVDIKPERPIKRALSIAKIRSIRDGVYSPAQQRGVDVFFLTMYLNGLNLKDIIYLKPDDYDGDRITINRSKTGEPLSIKVFPEAKAILDKYKGQKYLLSFLDKDDSFDRYMLVLKIINNNLKSATGMSNMTMYYARHSISSILAELDTPIETISAVLGHSLPGSSMTGMYVTFNLRKVDDAMRKAIDYINGKEEVKQLKIAQ